MLSSLQEGGFKENLLIARMGNRFASGITELLLNTTEGVRIESCKPGSEIGRSLLDLCQRNPDALLVNGKCKDFTGDKDRPVIT